VPLPKTGCEVVFPRSLRDVGTKRIALDRRTLAEPFEI
jgi:hypothetical protein